MKAIERIYQYIEFEGVKPKVFEENTGLSNGYLGKQLKRNADLGEGILIKILDNCPNLNPIWLLTGIGQMTLQTVFFENTKGIDTIHVDDPLTAYHKSTEIKRWALEDKENALKEPHTNIFKLKTDSIQQKQSVPLYDLQASASVVALFRDSNNEKPVDHITIPNLPKCDGAIYVNGDSMYPLLKSGDIIMYKKVGNSIDNMFWGEMYLVSLVNDDGDEFVMVKWLHKSDKGEEYVKLVSENRHHQPKDFHINNIKGLALIKASIRVNSMY